MNYFTTCFILLSFCLFGNKLKVVNTEFVEVQPGIAMAPVITKFNLEIKSTGASTINITSVWIKNQTANFELSTVDGKYVDEINSKGSFFIKGKINTYSNDIPQNAVPLNTEKQASFKDEVVISYKTGNSSTVKYLTIPKIENLKIIATS